MRPSPSIVPADRLDRDIYLVLEDFGARAGCAWRETDEDDTDRETIIRDILSGNYAYPIRIVAFNAIEGRSRDATSDLADELAQRVGSQGLEVSPALRAFINANSTRSLEEQLALPLRGAA
ncbi:MULTISPECIES: hypothetical protein [unclassified Bradyrhizobium]|uniref:hypothetical protein n=1 Tax=unclassified Bradyrhizobium TaxID=2631580 RepID=UPI0020B1E2B2|nr:MULTISPECIES: hypothetical protein [unclassified Bradyrhizobium]MCP3398977.1 hypothetical protein [Bradyrhizobium sp. CCGB20]MCP3407578.1 hypothetical protein [Bradyrhizobium sp. CCGB01]